MTVQIAGRSVQADPRLAWRSVRAEALTFPRSLWLWLGFLGIFLAIGAVAALRSLIPGDKGVGTTPSFEWGLLIIGYVFFAITTSGLCLASSLGTVFGIERFRPLEKRHAILAVLSLVTAFGIIALDLHYPLRLMFGVVMNPSPTSPMWWMGVCYGFYLCVLLTEVWSMFTDHPTIHQYACTAAMCTAIVAPTTLGAVFGVLAGRAFWFGPFTPILMVATAFLAGTSLLGIVFYFVHRLRLAGWERAASVAIPSIRLLLAVGIVLVAALVTREVVVGMLSSDRGMVDATRALVAGPLALQFWGLRVIAGLVVPFLLIALPITRTPAGTFAASALIWIGVFADRFTFVSAGQIAPVTAISGVVSNPYASYTPSPVEIGIILGALAFIAFVYTLAERYLDLHEAAAHGALSLPRILPARFRTSAATAGAVHGHDDAAPIPAVEPVVGAGPVALAAAAPAIRAGEPEPVLVERPEPAAEAEEPEPAAEAEGPAAVEETAAEAEEPEPAVGGIAAEEPAADDLVPLEEQASTDAAPEPSDLEGVASDDEPPRGPETEPAPGEAAR